MNADLRTYTAIALLAMCGCASAEPVSAYRYDTSAVQLAESDTGAGLHEAAMADTSGVRSATASHAGNVATASAEDAAPAAGERRAPSGQRPTLRQKRIFVLGLAAQENK
jgi:hypothetical protein